jgi:hypothetical protein
MRLQSTGGHFPFQANMYLKLSELPLSAYSVTLNVMAILLYRRSAGMSLLSFHCLTYSSAIWALLRLQQLRAWGCGAVQLTQISLI